MSAQTEFELRRILVAVDSSAHARRAAELAARLAAEFRSSLEGLFVEDIDLVHLAALRIGRVVRYPYGEAGEFDELEMEGQFRDEQAQARRVLDAASSTAGVKCSFRVVRGRVASEVLQAARAADLLIVGIASRPLTGRVRLGSVARAALSSGPAAVLIHDGGDASSGPPMVVFDGSDSGARALLAAGRIARARSLPLRVVINAPEGEPSASAEAAATELTAAKAIALEFERPGAVSADSLCALVKTAAPGLLVLGASDPMLSDCPPADLVERLGCPLLLVR